MRPFARSKSSRAPAPQKRSDRQLLRWREIFAISVAPTDICIGWRQRVRADPSFRPPADEIKQLRQSLYVEAGHFALIPICAAAMARG
jgi:hypothetical protein